MDLRMMGAQVATRSTQQTSNRKLPKKHLRTRANNVLPRAGTSSPDHLELVVLYHMPSLQNLIVA